MTSATDQPTSTNSLSSFPGWRVVAGCFFVLLINSGFAFYGLSVYLNAFSKEQDWPLGSISFAVTIFFIIGGLFGLVAARLITRYDVRAVIIAGAVISGGSLAAVGQVTAQWQLYIAYGVFGIGYALAKRLIDDNGLAMSTPWLGLIFVAAMVPVTLFLVRPDPVVDGFAPDGERLVVGSEAPTPTGSTYSDALSTRFYRAVTYGYVLVLGSQVGGIQQLVKLVAYICVDRAFWNDDRQSADDAAAADR